MDEFDISKGLEALSRHVVHCNGYAERMKPWELNKDPAEKGPPRHRALSPRRKRRPRRRPALPRPAGRRRQTRRQLNLPSLTNLQLPDLRWGLLPDGHAIGKPKPFPRHRGGPRKGVTHQPIPRSPPLPSCSVLAISVPAAEIIFRQCGCRPLGRFHIDSAGTIAHHQVRRPIPGCPRPSTPRLLHHRPCPPSWPRISITSLS